MSRTQVCLPRSIVDILAPARGFDARPFTHLFFTPSAAKRKPYTASVSTPLILITSSSPSTTVLIGLSVPQSFASRSMT